MCCFILIYVPGLQNIQLGWVVGADYQSDVWVEYLGLRSGPSPISLVDAEMSLSGSLGILIAYMQPPEVISDQFYNSKTVAMFQKDLNMQVILFNKGTF